MSEQSRQGDIPQESAYAKRIGKLSQILWEDQKFPIGECLKFEDLYLLDDLSIQLLLREMYSQTLLEALCGASPRMREKFFKNMSTAAAIMCRKDVEVMEDSFSSEVTTAAQDEILAIDRRINKNRIEEANRYRQLMEGKIEPEYPADQNSNIEFEVLLELEDRDIHSLLRQIDSELLIVALTGASRDLREKIFRNMSPRGAEMLREDLEMKGPVGVFQVAEAQDKILAVMYRGVI